jgi:rhodanese-related sulfurtransferase
MVATSTLAPSSSPSPSTGTSGSDLEVSPIEVSRWLEAGEAVLVDVREPDEHARESISNSKLAPLSRFDPAQAASLPSNGQKLVFHCMGGKRSADALRMTLASDTSRGIECRSMKGGIQAWKAAGLPVRVDTRANRISLLRQMQLVVGVSVLTGSALAWWVHPLFIGIPAFFGAGLLFAGVSGTCALITVLGWMPWNRTPGSPPAQSCSR